VGEPDARYEVLGWAGRRGRVVGRCKYCNCFSFAEVMMVDKSDSKPYHPKCEEIHNRELAERAQNL